MNRTFNNAVKIDPYIYSFRFMYDNVSYILHANKDMGIIFLDNILTIPEQLHSISPALFKNNHCLNMFDKLSKKINPLDSTILDEYVPMQNNKYFL